MSCEICGNPFYGGRHRIIMDGAHLIVCENCRSYGTPYHGPAEGSRNVARRQGRPLRAKISRKTADVGISEYEVVEDYPIVIREGRSKNGLTQKDLAKKINERISVIQKVEIGKLSPDSTLCRKLEHTLRVKLIVPRMDKESPKNIGERAERTLGDVVRIKRRDTAQT